MSSDVILSCIKGSTGVVRSNRKLSSSLRLAGFINVTQVSDGGCIMFMCVHQE